MAFHDGLGHRRVEKDASGAEFELLVLRQELATVPSFEFALRERAARLATFRHPAFAYTRRVERPPSVDGGVTVVSDHVAGVKLATLLADAETRGLPPDLGAALCLLRQLIPAIAILHESARDVSHGAIAPDRLVVTPNARLVVTDYVLGSALEQLLYSRDRYWTELRVALPRAAGLARFDHAADVLQVGAVALSLVLGRRLKDDEQGSVLADLVAGAQAHVDGGKTDPLPEALRQWLQRALHLDPRGAFPSAVEARLAFERVLDECVYDASPARLDAWLSRLRQPPTAGGQPLPATSAPKVEPIAEASARVDAVVRVASVTYADREASVAPEMTSTVEASRPVRSRRMLALAGVVLAVAGIGATLAGPRLLATKPTPITTGTLSITTDPAGAQASIDGAAQGVTPLSLSVAAGTHTLLVRGEYGERSVTLTIAPAAQVAQYLDLPKAPALPIPVEPAVAVPPPVAAPALTTPATDALMAGWISVASRFDVQLFEAGQLIGTSQSQRVMVAAGTHALELVNDELGYRTMRTVQVVAGKVSTLTIEAPAGTIALNAMPWAEVTIDGQKAGETPLGNVSLGIGAHDIVFRHPELGEQRHRVSVTLKAPARLSADLRAK